MLQQREKSMQNKRIVLASGSPRRKELLMRMGLSFDLMPCDVEEVYDDSLLPIEVAEYLAKLKAKTANQMISSSVVIGSDTIVSVNGNILGKPKDKDDAYKMIKKLNDNWHEVITGICIYDNDKYILDHEVTRVHFVKMTDDEILGYVNTDEPYDKAGAYGVQGIAGMYIDTIEGDFYNIMGFPMAKVRNMLKTISAIG